MSAWSIATARAPRSECRPCDRPGREHDPGAPRVVAEPAARRRRRPERRERVAVLEEHLPAVRLRAGRGGCSRSPPIRRRPAAAASTADRSCAGSTPASWPASRTIPAPNGAGPRPSNRAWRSARSSRSRVSRSPTAGRSGPRPDGPPQPSTGTGPTARAGDSAAAGAARQVFSDLPPWCRWRRKSANARPQRTGGLRGVAPTLAPDPEPGQVPGLHLVRGFPGRPRPGRPGTGPRRACFVTTLASALPRRRHAARYSSLTARKRAGQRSTGGVVAWPT